MAIVLKSMQYAEGMDQELNIDAFIHESLNYQLMQYYPVIITDFVL